MWPTVDERAVHPPLTFLPAARPSATWAKLRPYSHGPVCAICSAAAQVWDAVYATPTPSDHSLRDGSTLDGVSLFARLFVLDRLSAYIIGCVLRLFPARHPSSRMRNNKYRVKSVQFTDVLRIPFIRSYLVTLRLQRS